MKTVSRSELIKKIKESGLEIVNRSKPTSEERNEELLKSLTDAIANVKLKSEVDADAAADNLLIIVDCLKAISESQVASGKRKWILDVVRDDEGLIKSIIARQI